MKRIPGYLNDILEIFFPSLCITCGDRLNSQEKFICMKCWFDLPVTRFENDRENIVAQLFWGRVHIEWVTSFFEFRKGSRYQKLIYFIKYKGLKELGLEAGKRFGYALKNSKNFSDIDLIIPVPLHKQKLKKRGYNQSEWIARGISIVLKKPVCTEMLIRTVNTPTQTRKGRYERWLNVERSFSVTEAEEIRGKHILLVDDVLTT